MNNTILKISKKVNLSPLRYPGGKKKIAPLVADIFARNLTPIDLLVEPFAGGAGVSIAFLESGLAKKIALADKDQYISSFWRIVFSSQAEQLVDRLNECEVSLKEWEKVKASTSHDDFERAFKCLYLNRTSFSGILHDHAGPIGGKSQEGPYKIGCRFNKEALSKRILQLSEYQHRVLFVRTQSYKKTISDVRKMKISRNDSSLYWYFDPPFFDKANKLYREYFDLKDHTELRQVLLGGSMPGQWVLSYDDVKIARDFYSQHEGFSRVNLSYNARIDSLERLTSSEIVVSNIIERLRQEGQGDIPIMGKVISLRDLSRSSTYRNSLWEAL